MARHMLVLRPRRSAMARLLFHAHAFGRVADADARGSLARLAQQRLSAALHRHAEEISRQGGAGRRAPVRPRRCRGRHRRPSHRSIRSIRGSHPPLPQKLRGDRSGSRPSRPRGHRNGRRCRRHDEDACARRNSGTRCATPAPARGANGACCAATATFFSWGPPWRELHQSASPPGPLVPVSRAASKKPRPGRGWRKQAAWVAGKAGRFQPRKPGSGRG